MKGKKQNTKYYVSGAAIGIILILVLCFAYLPFSPWYQWWVKDEEEPTPALTTSTFELIDYRTGEVVSPWVEISVWTADPDDLPFDDEDPHRLINFDEKISSSDANDVSIDLRPYAEAYLQIDPDYESDYGGYNGVFNPTITDDFRKLDGGANHNYKLFVYHLPSNVSVTVRDRITNNEWDLTTGGHFVTDLNMPWNSTDGLHAGVVGGDEWEIDDEELADMTTSDLIWLYDQENHRTIAPFYSLNDDAGKDYDDRLELWTNCFGVNFTMNTSISESDGNVAQVNFTLYERDYNIIPAEVVFSAESILVIFYEPITCYDQKYSFEFDIALGVNITCTSVSTGRVFTPYGDDNLGDWTEINVAPL